MTTNNSVGGAVVESTILTEAYECDYERNCTPLYKAIETAEDEDEYESILDFLETGVWNGPFEGIGGPSPVEQVKTWVTRFDNTDETKVKWSQLPLHLAIVCGAPAQIVASLVKLYPEALRCTDDQHMLPLHLALRHESDDEVVAFLLIQFPESVNAKGKNGRTAVDCALRAKDKLRGIMLEIFTEKTAAKITAQMNKEKKELMNELENRTSELLITAEVLDEKIKENEELMKQLSEQQRGMNAHDVQHIRDEIEAEYKQAHDELEASYNEAIEKLQGEKLLQEVIAQKKIDQLLTLVKEKEASEKNAREEEIAIKRELEAVQGKVAGSTSPSDWKEVKKEVATLKAYRLEKTRSETRSTIDSLRSELDRSVELSKLSDQKLKSELKEEMKMLKSIVDKLQKTESAAKTSSELTELRNEVDALRAELKERSQVKQTIVEIALIKKALEHELTNADGKTHLEIVALKEAIDKANATDLDKKNGKELTMLKEELESLKRELKEKELASKTAKDVQDLKVTLEREMINADSKTKAEMNEMKTIVDNLQAALLSNRSSDDMVLIKQEVETLKEEFKKKETASKIKLEAAMLKKMVETELKQSEGRTQEELLQMKQSIKELTDKALDDKNVEELSKVRSELILVKDELKEIEKISKTQQELELLKQNVQEQIKNTKGKTDEEIQSMKRAFDALNSDHVESRQIKVTLEEEIKKNSGKTEQELKALKKSIDSIDLQKLERKTQNEWKTIRKEMDILTAYLKKKQQDGVGETQNEIRNVKAAIDAIDLNKLEREHQQAFHTIRTEMEQMKYEMKQKEIQEAYLKRELETLKYNAEMAAAAASNKKKGLRSFLSRAGSIFGNTSNSNKNGTTGSGAAADASTTKSLQNIDAIGTKSTTVNEDVAIVSEPTTIAPPSLALLSPTTTTTTFNAPPSPTNSVTNAADDSSYSSAIKDAEKSRSHKVKELSLMQSKSREFDQQQHNDDNNFDDEKEEMKILSIRLSKSEIGNTTKSIPVSSSAAAVREKEFTNFTSLKKVKSEYGKHTSSTKALATPVVVPAEKSKPAAARSILKQSVTTKDNYYGNAEERDPAPTSSYFASKQKVQQQPRASAMKGSKIALRKVRSMDPRLSSSNRDDSSLVSDASTAAYDFVHTPRSKPVIGHDGEIELHEVNEEEDDEEEEEDDRMIHPRVSFVSHFE